MNNVFEDFKLAIEISRAYEKDGRWLFEGIASSTAVDTHDTIFTLSCQEDFAFQINNQDDENPIELESEHTGDDLPFNILGSVVSAYVDELSRLRVTCELDKDSPHAEFYWNKMTKPNPKTGKVKQFGLSIHGVAIDAGWEFSKERNKTIQAFYKVRLKRVGIVRKPSNPESWVTKMMRSVDWNSLKSNELVRSESDSRSLMITSENKEDDVNNTENAKNLILGQLSRGEPIDISGSLRLELQDWLLSMASNLAAVQPEVMMSADTSNMAESTHEDLSDEIAVASSMLWTEDEMRAAFGPNKLRMMIDDEECEFDCDEMISIARKWKKMSKEMNMSSEKRSEQVDDSNTEENASQMETNETTVETVARSCECPEGEDCKCAVPTSDTVTENVTTEDVSEVATDVIDTVEDVAVTEAESAVVTEEVATEVVADVVTEVETAEAPVVERSAPEVDTDSKIVELLRAAVVESMKPQFDSLQEAVDSLKTKNEELVTRNAELVERLAIVEGKPAKAPGILNISDDIVQRNSNEMSPAQKREISIKRAVDEKDKNELIKLKVHQEYLGKQFS